MVYMKGEDIKTIGIMGAGVMGGGIGQTAAEHDRDQREQRGD